MANLVALRASVFFAICEKPEGGGADNRPPGRARVKVIADDTPNLIFITECLPKFHTVLITAALLSIYGYTLFTNFERGANVDDGLCGICVYVRADLLVSEMNFVRAPSIEQLQISVRLRGADQLIAGCLYRSSSRDAHQCMCS